MMTEEKYRLLADAGRILASSLDLDTTLANLSRLIVPDLADWFAVDLVNDAGGLDRIFVSHSDPAKLLLAHELFATYPPRRDAPKGQWSIIRSGKPEWAASIDDSLLESLIPEVEYRKAVAQLALRSYIQVPLATEAETVGVLTIVHSESGHNYVEADIEPIAQLGKLVAFSIQNARSHARLQALAERKDEFLATLAHELRNPLAPIVSAAQVLEASADHPERVRAIALVIQRQARHMSSLVEDLLDAARVSRGDFAFAPMALDVTRPVAEAVEQIRPELDKRGQRLEVSGLDNRVCVMADSTRLVQIVANLLGNATRYTPDGGSIRLVVDTEGADAVVKVCDDGIGISAEFLPHVFELFSQQSRGLERQHAGLGLGLALVKRLVERHGGSVTAESRGLGTGSCFSVRLPLVEDPMARRACEAAADASGA